MYVWTDRQTEWQITLTMTLPLGLRGAWGNNDSQPLQHYNDVIMSMMASQITSLAMVYLTVYSRRRSKKTSKLHVNGLCEGNSPVTGEFPTQRASKAENVFIWWRHHEMSIVAHHNGITPCQTPLLLVSFEVYLKIFIRYINNIFSYCPLAMAYKSFKI